MARPKRAGDEGGDTPSPLSGDAAPALPTTGTAAAGFACVYGGALLQFRPGQRIEADPPLARYLADHGLPIVWDTPA